MCAAALHGAVLQVQYRVACTAVSGEMLRVTVVSDASCPCVVFSTTRQVSEHLARRLQVWQLAARLTLAPLLTS